MLAQLEAERARLKAIIDNAPEAIVVADADCRILLTNRAADRLYARPVPYGQGYDQHDALELSYADGTPCNPRDLPLTRAALDGETLHDVELAITWPDGQQRALLVNAAPIRGPDGSVTGAVGVFRDITERIEMEDALRQARNHMERQVHERTVELVELNEALQGEIAMRERVEGHLKASEERFRQLAENINEVFWLIEPASGQLLYVSPAYEAVWGQPRDPLYKDATVFLDSIHEDDRQRIGEIWDQGWRDPELEFRVVRPDGTLRWIRARAFPVRDEQNRVYRIAGIARDVTEQKRAQAVVVQAERLSMAAQLAASLAHEINNPLQSVVGCLDLALEALDAGRKPRKYITVASKASERAARVVAQLRELHRRSRLEEKQATNINLLIDNVLILCQKRCRLSAVEVVWQKNPDLPDLELMPDAMQQIFLNLVTNAIDAMPGGGRLEVIAERTSQPPGVRVAFADTGTGMSPRALERLFEPFHTTKADGLGLGLFISQNIAQQHGGHIEVESQPGKGTTFNVWVPASHIGANEPQQT
jgi:PAS domain S-box-containing protein